MPVKILCSSCNRPIKAHHIKTSCEIGNVWKHVKCTSHTPNVSTIPNTQSFICSQCQSNVFPFSNLDNIEFLNMYTTLEPTNNTDDNDPSNSDIPTLNQ